MENELNKESEIYTLKGNRETDEQYNDLTENYEVTENYEEE